MRAHQPIGAVLVLVVVNLAPASSPAAAADLDPSFGNGGIVLTDVSGGYDEARAIAIDPDGRIIVAGVSGTGSGRNFAIARYNADGALDRTFGAGGTVMTDFSGGSDVVWALAIQPDGKILAAGEANGDFALARYLELAPQLPAIRSGRPSSFRSQVMTLFHHPVRSERC